MPIIITTKNLKFYVFTNDHKPMHIHVIGPDANAKFGLTTIECISSKGFSEKDLNRIQKFISKNKELLIEAWEDFHEEQ